MKDFLTSTKGIILSSFILSVVFLLLFAFNVNPFFLNNGGDSAIYQQMGQCILLGKVPYLDLFDHKGFILYCIQALGLWIHDGHLGLFILSVINLWVSLYLGLKASRLFIQGFSMYIPILVTLGIYVITIGKGNDTEFWSLPYIFYALYLLCRYYHDSTPIKFIECFMIGCGMGVITFIRLNNMAPICCVCVAISILYVKKKQYKLLIESILVTLCGFLTVSFLSIFLFYVLYGYENLYYLYFGTFKFNFQYAVNHGNGSILQLPFYCTMLLLLIAAIINSKKHIWKTVFLTFALFVSYATFGKAYYSHYYTITLPVITLILICIVNSDLYKNLPGKRIFFYVSICIIGIGAYLIWPNIAPRIERGRIMELGMSDIQNKLSKLPPKELDSIWNYNTSMGGANYLQSVNRIQMNRIFLEMQLHVTDELTEIGDIRDLKPLYIMLKDNSAWTSKNRLDSVFISENYDLAFQTNIKTDSLENTLFFKRKNAY